MDQAELSAIKQISGIFLPENATLEQRWKALRLNHRAWYERLSIANDYDEIGCADDLQWTYNQVSIPSEESLQDDEQIDKILTWYRDRRDLHRTNGAIFWYVNPTPPTTLGARLYARGVGPNWRPLWMWRELYNLVDVQEATTEVEIQIAGEEHSSVAQDAVMVALYRIEPRGIWHISASKPGKSGIGGCTISVTIGEFGISGLYDLWVDPSVRKQGIGSAIVRSACLLARRLGCHHMLVNSSEMGESTYRRTGFQSMGHGYTWFLSSKTIKKPPPSNEMVKFLEAIGTGDITGLNHHSQSLTPADLQSPTLNDKTPLEIAALTHQRASALWLLDHHHHHHDGGGTSITPDIMSLWDLDLKERVPALLAAHPELVRRTGGRWTATPLHDAIERGDVELVRVLLAVPNDLGARDRVFGSTPEGWARRFGRADVLGLLEEHVGWEAEGGRGKGF